MKRTQILALSGVLAIMMTAPARAQIPGLGGIGGIFGGGPIVVYDPSAVAKLVDQLRAQAEQIGMQQTQVEQQLLAMRKLPNPPWREIRLAMEQLEALMRNARALTYAIENLDQEFQATYPVTRIILDWPAEERAQAERMVATMRATVNAARTQAASFAPGLERIAEMKAAVGAIQGHEAALELQNTATVYTAEELMLLRQAILSQANAQAI